MVEQPKLFQTETRRSGKCLTWVRFHVTKAKQATAKARERQQELDRQKGRIK